MRYSLFNKAWDTSHKVAVASVFSNIILTSVVLIQAVTISNKVENTIIVPPIIDQTYQIQRDSANAEYYQAMAVVFSNIIGQTTQKNLETSRKTLTQFLAPALQRQMNESLSALASKLPKDNFTTWFTAKNVFYEAQTNKIFVQGSLQSSLIGAKVLDQPVVYEYIIKMNAGKPVITYFNSYDGNNPHTLAFIQNEKANALQASQQKNR